ncbi:MAG: nucleoside hydrolase [Clostridiales bacterium]|jgi:pyrimidine-specific ribonucleoside hydrolase|nr:nucleoside hydrolase [Clostridiales bacterium]
MEARRKIILDCDPGHDDAFAIILAASHLDVLGVTTIGGNCCLGNVTKNALKTLEVIDRTDIPVYAGHSRPMVAELVTAPQFHGESGLDGPVLPDPVTAPQKEHAVDFIVETVKSVDGVTLVPTGPLTNIAAALNRAPEIAGRIREICLMGGSVTFGNWTPAAEFNIFVDPEAAYRVFNSGVPIKMSGVNLTRQCAVSRERVDEIAKIPTRTAKFAVDLLNFFLGTSKEAASLPAANLHDACAVAWLIRPELITAAPMHITVELKGEFTRGMTVCDYRHLRCETPGTDVTESPTMGFRGERPNAEAALRLDFPGFMDLLIQTLRDCP